jgi:hypothetical protein
MLQFKLVPLLIVLDLNEILLRLEIQPITPTRR